MPQEQHEQPRSRRELSTAQTPCILLTLLLVLMEAVAANAADAAAVAAVAADATLLQKTCLLPRLVVSQSPWQYCTRIRINICTTYILQLHTSS